MNASQGQTLKKVGVWLVESQCFAHGQLYVAASRTGSPSDLHFATTESGVLQDSLARNVVYREVGWNHLLVLPLEASTEYITITNYLSSSVNLW